MARFIPKQFAENSTTSVVFGSFQEQGGNPGDGTISSDPATLQGGTAWPLGWSAATDNFFQIPRGEEMEGLERVLSAAIIQQFKDGLTFWQPEMPVTQYQTIVQYQTGSDLPKLYINITGTSTATPPDLDTTNWYMFLDTDASYANVALTNSPYTTNRILEIPQDIKLELNNGTLTLKAGSKVYVPNGFEADGTTPKFDVVTIESDISDLPDSNRQALITVVYNSLFILPPEFFTSGTTAPTSFYGSNFAVWYDTTNNKIKATSNGGVTWDERASFPICKATETTTSYSIDQIFNGFGYMGSTVFALPGVKVQIPNGRNADGTCRSIIATVDSVKTVTRTDSLTTSKHWYLLNNLNLFSSSAVSFDADKNIYVGPSGVVITVEIAYGYLTSGKVTSFEPYTVDSVLNSNLSNLSAAGQAKFDAKADKDLSNLTATGEAHFANPDMSNLSTTGKSAVVDLSAPDYTAGVDYVASWGSSITTIKSGWVFVSTNDSGASTGSQAKFHIEQFSLNVTQNSDPSYGVNGACMFFVPANATWSASGGNGYNRQLYFFPCKGA